MKGFGTATFNKKTTPQGLLFPLLGALVIMLLLLSNFAKAQCKYNCFNDAGQKEGFWYFSLEDGPVLAQYTRDTLDGELYISMRSGSYLKLDFKMGETDGYIKLHDAKGKSWADIRVRNMVLQGETVVYQRQRIKKRGKPILFINFLNGNASGDAVVRERGQQDVKIGFQENYPVTYSFLNSQSQALNVKTWPFRKVENKLIIQPNEAHRSDILCNCYTLALLNDVIPPLEEAEKLLQIFEPSLEPHLKYDKNKLLSLRDFIRGGESANKPKWCEKL